MGLSGAKSIGPKQGSQGSMYVVRRVAAEDDPSFGP
jgi:hypothetical protein